MSQSRQKTIQHVQLTSNLGPCNLRAIQHTDYCVVCTHTEQCAQTSQWSVYTSSERTDRCRLSGRAPLSPPSPALSSRSTWLNGDGATRTERGTGTHADIHSAAPQGLGWGCCVIRSALGTESSCTYGTFNATATAKGFALHVCHLGSSPPRHVRPCDGYPPCRRRLQPSSRGPLGAVL